jgi:hypothetical protein
MRILFVIVGFIVITGKNTGRTFDAAACRESNDVVVHLLIVNEKNHTRLGPNFGIWVISIQVNLTESAYPIGSAISR